MKKKGSSRGFLKRLLERLKRSFRPKADPEPEDPYAYRMAPLHRPPRGRSGAAVADLGEE